MFELKRDGKLIKTFDTENQALIHLHKIQPQSWDYALKYAGYTIEETGNQTQQLDHELTIGRQKGNTMTYKPIETSKVKTIIRSNINGQLYASPHYWRNPTYALAHSTIIENPPNFELIIDEEQIAELKVMFGDLPEYPGEYIELEKEKHQ